MPREPKSVAALVSIALVTSTTLFLAAWGLYTYLSSRASLWSVLRNTVTASAERASIALALPIWSIDRTQIDLVIESTMREPAIFAVVVEAAGRTHATARDASWNAVPSGGDIQAAGLLREDRAVVFGDDRIGTVSVYATPRFVEEELRGMLFTAIVGISLLDAALVAILWLVLWRVVLEPLRAVERYAEAVSSGSRPDATLPGSRFRGEIDSLLGSMRRMVSLLDARYVQVTKSEEATHALAARLQAVREEEQTRISRDLHDELGQLLTGIQLDLRWLERKLGDLPDNAVTNPLIDQVVETSRLVEKTVTTVQRIAADLRPSALDRLGLAAALRHEVRRFQERTSIPCELILGERLPELYGDTATALYRIAQEALTNVARHAQASKVAVALTIGERFVTLRVEDDGRGIDAVSPGPHALGLMGIKERATMLGGEVTFARGAERGTVVELRVPVSCVTTPATARALS